MRQPTCVCLFLIVVMLAGCRSRKESASHRNDSSKEQQTEERQTTETPVSLDVPLGLPPIKTPKDNPLTKEKIALGEKLFFDQQLSVDGTMSCATCHDPEKGWSNGQRVAEGVHGEFGTRNVPTLINVAYNRRQFWDGRASSLEKQALGPILNPIEMAMPSQQALLDRLRGDSEYPAIFARAFADGITATNVSKAIACFERTILVGDAPIDRFLAGDEDAMSDQAKRGWQLYLRKARCNGCHPAPNFTDDVFHNLGVGTDQPDMDVGFKAVTGAEIHTASFKTPTLRNIVKTAPYMHDGSMKTLDEVIEFYNKGGLQNSWLDMDMWKNGKPNLTDQEKLDLKQFLIEGLTSEDVPAFKRSSG